MTHRSFVQKESHVANSRWWMEVPFLINQCSSSPKGINPITSTTAQSCPFNIPPFIFLRHFTFIKTLVLSHKWCTFDIYIYAIGQSLYNLFIIYFLNLIFIYFFHLYKCVWNQYIYILLFEKYNRFKIRQFG